MPCYHPNYGVFVPGRKQPKILPKIGLMRPVPDKILYQGDMRDVLQLPCGQCIGCRLEYSRQWADRCVMETMTTPDDMSWFVTLTYDDDNIPSLLSGDVDSPFPGSINWDDHQKFVKRLRDHADRHDFGHDLRHYSAAEYGVKGLRPHYHMMLYNMVIPDLKYYKRNKQGDILYTSDIIADIWQGGFVVIGKADWRTAAYTARYVIKKRKGKEARQYYTDFGIAPESTRSSNRPGIASAYYDEHWHDLYYGSSQKIVLPSIGDMANITTPPRFFDEKFRLVDPDRLVEIKLKRREIAIELQKQRSRLLGIVGQEQEYFESLEQNLLKKPQMRIDI